MSFSDRRYEEVPIELIKVINSRDRDNDQFKMNVSSISELGLMKPIRVNDKFLEKTGFYELICGEGRLLAHKELGKTRVLAEVVTCTRKEAYLQSLVENIARTKPGTMDFARELKRLRDEGWEYAKIAKVACKTAEYIRQYIRLIEQGEERLILGVEQGVFPITFALQVTNSDNSQLQHLLMDAFDQGIVTTANFAHARKIITQYASSGKKRAASKKDYTVDQLKQDIADATKQKTNYVKQAEHKENRFLTLLTGINAIWRDEEFRRVLTEEGLDQRPDLMGDFKYEQQ
ncbi:ParB/RepB/Spo0J family partition protein [Pirellula sp. SH-Sr6A]|uniref:ParB/RepB/Spo0J family partition protein n=1 Tax=Pirellula sp. SH-Sr6A TaxID=1632865 RepID=UPI00197C1C6B|nr:ParB N-terminal domain-containing protein [Pirellula sp. SH-Sr6A]